MLCDYHDADYGVIDPTCGPIEPLSKSNDAMVTDFINHLKSEGTTPLPTEEQGKSGWGCGRLDGCTYCHARDRFSYSFGVTEILPENRLGYTPITPSRIELYLTGPGEERGDLNATERLEVHLKRGYDCVDYRSDAYRYDSYFGRKYTKTNDFKYYIYHGSKKGE